MPKREPAGCGVGQGAPRCWASMAGPRVNAGTIAVPSRSDGAHTEASASGVNPSAPLASAGPHVGVAEIGQLDDPVALLVQRDAVERDGHSVAGSADPRMVVAGAIGPEHLRPAAASPARESSVRARWWTGWRWPSACRPGDHRYTVPWPKPWCTPSIRTSNSTHSVGTTATTRRVLSRLLDGVPAAERLADAERHVVAQDGQGGRRRLDIRDPHPQGRATVRRPGRRRARPTRCRWPGGCRGGS